MAKNKSLVKDERLAEIIRRICTWLYFATMVMLSIDLFYRQFVLKQNNSQFEDRFSPEDRAAVGPVITQQLDDPTIKLNERQYAATSCMPSAVLGTTLTGRARKS